MEKYKISQTRFMKIRGPINPTPEEVIWSTLERRSLTDKETNLRAIRIYILRKSPNSKATS